MSFWLLTLWPNEVGKYASVWLLYCHDASPSEGDLAQEFVRGKMGPCPAPQAWRALSLGKQVGKVVPLQTCSIHVEKRTELSLRGIRVRAVHT